MARWTGIPVAKLMEGEREKLLHLDEILHKRVVGQDEAVYQGVRGHPPLPCRDPGPGPSHRLLPVPGSHRRAARPSLPRHWPKRCLTTSAIMVRIDMTEYMEKFSVSRLIGAPPGYVGYEEGGQLTEAVRRKPYSVVLFDEVEKAHPDVFNILLQVLDDGRITDSQGRTVDFKNTIIILTSNLGSPYILDGIDENGNITESARAEVEKLLRQQFRPEFLNRLDEIVFYKPLQKEETTKIVDLLVADLQKRLADRQLGLRLTDAAKDFIVDGGYDPVYGARPLKRFLQHSIETVLARKIIAEDPEPGTVYVADVKDGELTIAPAKSSSPETPGH